MEYANGAASYALSNPSILLCSCLKASLDVFLEFKKFLINKFIK
jgi:hypothetical protein